MRRVILAILIFVVIGPVPGTVQRPATKNYSQTISAAALVYPADTQGMLRFVRGWRLESANTQFGGFSALAHIGPDRFMMASDIGIWARLTLNEKGQVSDTIIGELPIPARYPRRKQYLDVEAMVFDAQQDRIWLALEGVNQIWRVDSRMTRFESRRRSPALFRWPAGSGPEAMVRLADGRTAVFSENADDDPRGKEALLYRDDPAVPGKPPMRFFYDAGGKGKVSDAAPLPDGRIMLVHRRLGFRHFFTTELAIVDPSDIRRDGVIRSISIGIVPAPLRDNFEGAAIAKIDGRTWLWLVSDDNFFNLQRTLLLQFELVDLPPPRKAKDMITPDSKKAAR